jgi:hypothetical protein
VAVWYQTGEKFINSWLVPTADQVVAISTDTDTKKTALLFSRVVDGAYFYSIGMISFKDISTSTLNPHIYHIDQEYAPLDFTGGNGNQFHQLMNLRGSYLTVALNEPDAMTIKDYIFTLDGTVVT